MTSRKLILQSLRFYWRTHLGVALGAAVATAVLVGALVVGDSVKHTLQRIVELRLGDVKLAMFTGDRFFTMELGEAIASDVGAPGAAALMLNGAASVQGQRAQTPNVQVIGVDDRFWSLGDTPASLDAESRDQVIVNQRLADDLDIELGDTLLLRVAKPSALSRDMALGSEAEESIRLTLTVKAIAGEEQFGRFSLRSSQIPPFNAFVPLSMLQRQAGVEGRANMMLLGGRGDESVTAEAADAVIGKHWGLDDANLELVTLRESDEPEASGDSVAKFPMPVVELRSSRIFIDPTIVDAAERAVPGGKPILTYFVNHIRTADGKSTPYSMVAAMRPPQESSAQEPAAPALPNPLPAGMQDDQIVIVQWLADQLGVQVGDELTLDYYVMGDARALDEQTATFTVVKVVPTEPAGGDRHLMPDFPGLSEAETPLDWRPPPDLNINTALTRGPPEEYWKAHKGAPKAFVTLSWAAKREHWGTRFGEATAIRWPVPREGEAPAEPQAGASAQAPSRLGGSLALPSSIAAAIRDELDPASIGLAFQPVFQQAMDATTQGTGATFGGLFIGLSFFLIVAALVLTGLLFALGVEQRTPEIGTLLALGLTPKQVRRLWLVEGGALAVVGAVVGLPLGVAYTRAMLWALQTHWEEAVVGASLRFAASPLSFVIGGVAGVLVALGAMWWVLRRQARHEARELLAARFGMETATRGRMTRDSGGDRGGDPRHRNAPAWGRRIRGQWALWVGVACILGAIGLALSQGGSVDMRAAGVFFGAGALLLVGGLLLCLAMLGRMGGGGSSGASATHLTMPRLGARNSGRRRGRSLATIGMLACGAFLIVAINAFRHDATADAELRTSGTGGFAFWAQTAIPVYHDLSDPDIRARMGLDVEALDDVSFIQMRLREGDEASCLNLNRPTTPPLLGLPPQALAQRGAFTFVSPSRDEGGADPWLLLSQHDDAADADQPVPAIVDDAVAKWILYKGVGDTIEYEDEEGNPFQVQIVGTIKGSILQGFLVISEAQFKRRYPSLAGYRAMLIDAPRDEMPAVREALTDSDLEDAGLTLMDTADRLAMFMEVENTYLTIFAVLGGLGLLLGSVGLGVVVLRNVLERRAELALMRAVGFRRAALRKLVLSEHWLLVAMGLGVGVVAAAVAILPAMRAPGADFPVTIVAVTLAAIVVSAFAWTTLASVVALRSRMIDALRSE